MTKEPKLSKQELEIAMAACCVGTMWDEYEGTEDFDHMVRRRVNHLIELVRKSQPSLPSNLDEATEKIAWDMAPMYPDISWDNCFEKIKEGIKAGAEWMAAQGETREVEVKEDAGGYPYVDIHFELYDYDKQEPLFKAGDKLIVQLKPSALSLH